MIARKVGGRPSKNPGEDVLNELYINQNKTQKEIAEILGVSPYSVRKWIANYRRQAREREVQAVVVEEPERDNK